MLKRHAARAGFQGVPMGVVSKWLGHFSIRITADTYAHLLPGQREQAAASMDNMLAQASGEGGEQVDALNPPATRPHCAPLAAIGGSESTRVDVAFTKWCTVSLRES